MNVPQQRKALRVVHLVMAFLLFFSFLAPIELQIRLYVFLVAFPGAAVTGIVMWQMPRIRRLLRPRTEAVPSPQQGP